ncbi:MAG: leucine-rich repeat domain-containing protein [Alphaproteobacteria bacterium]|nr:leucine-rich repeat domain-containing protein [Alphaproteobacteria bacterium]
MKKWVLMMLFISSCVFADDEVWPTSGSCAAEGENNVCEWSFDASTGTLTIFGNGEIADYGYETNPYFDTNIEQSVPNRTTAPWGKYNNLIETIDVQKGITALGKAAFVGLENVTNVNLPDTLETIGEGAFDQMSRLQNLSLPDSVNSVGYAAFAWTQSLEKLDIGDGFDYTDYQEIYAGRRTTFDYLGQAAQTVATGTYTSTPNPNVMIYCQKGVSGTCDKIKDDFETMNLVQYRKDGDRYVLDGKRYKTVWDMQNENPVKRIYTIDEANKVAGDVNRVSIRYR